MLGIIYKATNVQNGKVYIGQTTTSLNERRKQHIMTAMSSGQRKYSFQLALKKYGQASFQWAIIDIASSQEELDAKEVKWIAHYLCYLDATKGYNRTSGGSAFPEEEQVILHYDYQGNFIGEYLHSFEASEKLGFDRRGIRRSCQSKCLLYRGHVFLYKNDYVNPYRAKQEVIRRTTTIGSRRKSFYLTA